MLEMARDLARAEHEEAEGTQQRPLNAQSGA
jgi:hypothetical protein